MLMLYQGCYGWYGGYDNTMISLLNYYSLHYKNTMRAMLLLSLHFQITTVYTRDLLVLLMFSYEYYQIYSNYGNYLYYC